MKIEEIRDMAVIDVIGFILIFTIFIFPDLRAIRIILGIPFVLFLPGYSLVSALFPGKKDLEGLERLALSLGLSLALVPLIGLILNYTPFGIRLYPVSLSLYLFMLAMTEVTYLRRADLPPKARFSIDFRSHIPKWSNMESEDKILAAGSVIAVIAAGLGGYFLGPSHHGEEFTEFYILGEGGKMEDYPTDLIVGEEGKLIVGIKNHEYRTENYRVLLTLENNPIESIESIKLNHGENWEEPVTFTVQEPGENMKLQALLYKGENTEPYRELHLWITVEGY